MREYRLTKYNPLFRNEKGFYEPEEWTFFAQVGTEVAGNELTLAEYEATEAAYIQVMISLFERAKAGPFRVSAKVVPFRVSEGQLPPAALPDGSEVPLSSLPAVLRSLLREEFWCRLTDRKGSFVHVGWDFYVYLGLPSQLESPEAVAQEHHLFLERCVSPHHPEAV